MNAVTDNPAEVAEWLADRQTMIGASDAAPLCGLSPYRGPLDVWAEKTGRAVARPLHERLYWGLALEQPIADRYELITGRKLHRQPTRRHPEYPWLGASLDRLSECGRIVDFKNVSDRSPDWGDPGSDEVPRHILVQMQQQMAVFGTDVSDVAALFGGCELRIYTVEFSPTLFDRMLSIADRFWHQHVLPDVPPPVSSPLDAETALKLYKPQAGLCVPLDGDAVRELIHDHDRAEERLAELRRDERETSAARDLIRGHLAAIMCEAEYGELPDGRTVRRRIVKRNGYSVQPCEYPEFKILKGGKR